MKLKSTYLFFLLFVLACSSNNKTAESVSDENPPSPGFNTTQSDSAAIVIADQVMLAMGGRKAWDNTRFIEWNFFGRRDLLWDKEIGAVRITSPGDSMVYLVNLNDKSGRVFKDKTEITDPDDLKNKLERGYSIWVNDSYWLCMPFKLKDSGVTLNYLRTDTTLLGVPSDVLGMRFENVGVTPQNRYEVWVDKSDHLIKQWAYFSEASQDSASAIWPWDNYQKIGQLMLSGDRSDSRGPKNVKVYDSVNVLLFKEL